jgi:hypothetical protein
LNRAYLRVWLGSIVTYNVLIKNLKILADYAKFLIFFDKIENNLIYAEVA